MIVMLAGPIKHWWDVWGTEEHEAYANWRAAVSDALVAAGHLVYRPHEAFKGEWYANRGEAAAQRVNDMAIAVCDVVLNLTPEGAPSHGTDDEIEYAAKIARLVVWEPPPERHYDVIADARIVAHNLERAVDEHLRRVSA